jgi:uncharacterized protein (DUF58 family)
MAWASLGADLLLGSLVWRDLRALGQIRSLHLERRREPVFSLGAANPVEIRVHNGGSQELWLEVEDEPPPSFAVDRSTFVVRLPADSQASLVYRATPPRRGEYRFGALNVRLRTRLGMLALQRRLAGEAEPEVRVYPDLQEVRKAFLLGLQDRLHEMGLRTVRRPEVGREFESLREYRPGDEVRSVDWKATARRGRLTVRNYDVEHSQRVLLVLDLGRTMARRLGDLTKADLALRACVLMASAVARTDDRLGILAFAHRVLGFLPPARGRTQLGRLLDFLYPLEAVYEESDYRRAFTEVAGRLRRRALVIVFTDLVDPESSSQLILHLSHLARHHAVLCVALSDYELEACLDQEPATEEDLYREAVARSLLEDRDQAAARLTAAGVRVLRASPRHLSIQVVNRYMDWKRTGRLG